ncbi:S41 family peptidase, partial [bacterium]|nr:S41 family peptidase [bacterium]
FSAIFDKDATKYLKEEQEGSFFGIGIQFDLIEEKITVISLIEGTPAFKAGLRAGDRIVKINGENAIGISQQDVLIKLKGPKGTSVNISVEREGIENLLEFTLIRDKIPSVSVPYSFMLNDEIGYLRITKFSQTTAAEVENTLSKLEDKKMTGLIIDLRNNPGGLLDQANRVSDMFIEGGKEIVSTRGRSKGSNHSFKSTGKYTHPFYPIVVLVNGGSASGAEILAGSIQDHDRGLILGTRSFGKGLVQNVHSLPLGHTLILTTQKYYTPSGRCIQKPYEEYNKLPGDDEEEENIQNSNTNKEIFYTDMKREVFGGGGIRPDVIFKNPKYGDAFKTIFLNDLFTTFGMHYAALNKELPPNFKVDEKVLNSFQDFINKKKVDVKIKDLGDDLEEAKLWLERVILTSIFGSEKSAEFWMKNDPEVIKAIEIMPDSQSLLVKRMEFTSKDN